MENNLKKTLMFQMLEHVPDLGWTWDALYKAAKTGKKTKNPNREELQTLFFRVVNGESEQYKQWLTYI